METRSTLTVSIIFLSSFILFSCGHNLSKDQVSTLIEKNELFIALGSNPSTTSQALYDGYMQGFWDQSGNPSPKGSEYFTSGPQFDKVQLKKPVKVKVVEVTNISNASSENSKEAQFNWEYSGVEGVARRFLVKGGTGNASFKLFDDGWRVDNISTKESKEGFSLSSDEQAAVDKDKQIESLRQKEEAQRLAEDDRKRQEDQERKAQLLESSKIPTRTIGTFNDINSFNAKPRSRGTLLTDVNVDRVGSPFDQAFTLWFGDIKDQPTMKNYVQTAMGWNGFCVEMNSTGYYSVVFKERDDCEKFYQALLKALANWHEKYKEIL
jgi:hypothetical protein